MIGEWWRRLAYLANGRRFERDLEEEMRFHLDHLKDARGDDSAARRQFGNATALKEISREMWGWSSLERLITDLRYAVRQLIANPGFAAAAILSLALGIGANTAIFGLIDHVMLRLLPVSHPEELMVMDALYSYPRFESLRDRNQVFSEMLGTHYMPDMQVAVENGVPASAAGELVSGSYFAALGVHATIGRTILPDDDRAAESGPVAVISDAYWHRVFAASPDVVGQKIRVRSGLGNGGTAGLDVFDQGHRANVNGAVLTIVGVAAPEFFGDTAGHSPDIWIPLTMQPAVIPGRPFLTQRKAVWIQTMARRKPGVSEAQARASFALTWRQILLDEAGSAITDARRREIDQLNLPSRIQPGARGFGEIRHEFSQPLLVLMCVVGLVLLISCLNVANLLLARATARRHEIAVRLSLGASRLRLIRQLLTESLVLAFAGAAAGIAVAIAGTQALIALIADTGSTMKIPFEMDFRTLGFTAAVALGTGILFGLAPALRATRVNIAEPMKDSRGATGAGAAKILVGAQIAVSMLLLVAAGLFLRTLYNLKSEDLGYNPDHLVLLRVDPVGAGYRGDDVGRSMRALLDRIRALPGVRVATLSENGLFSGTESSTNLDSIEGFTPHTDEDSQARFDQIGPDYFSNLGIPILLGREITDRDVAGAQRVAVINDTMAKFYFPGVNPIGRHVADSPNVSMEIVGVIRGAQDHDLRAKPVRRFYVPYLQPIDGITTANFEIRTAGDPGSVVAELRREVQRFNRNLPIRSIKDIRQLIDESLVSERLIAKLSTFFGALAILLAAIGLYGVTSYAVARRTTEIGIRMALGAARASVIGMVLGEVGVLLAIGGLAGAVAAFASARLIKGFLFGLAPLDLVSLAGAAALLAIIGALAGYLPARRASRIDPVNALRYQ